ncbi:MAG TPA: IS630 family transposase [Candidatus Hydrogenedentes bacterium]|jgi:transposase|nr:IS630 family transposase [Candidatus Hydrogenedentota bacterium]
MTTKLLETTLETDELNQLEQWVKAHGTPQQVVLRSLIGLEAASGRSDLSIASELDMNRHSVRLWRQRIAEEGIGTVWAIASGRGRKARYGSRKRDKIIRATLQDRPAGQTHWSCRTMAAAQGVSKNTISRLWQLHNLKPHLHKTFKLSRDPKFIEKMTDVVGLYLNPPQKAVVICVDEKSQIQALDRTQPGLPLKKGRCGTYTHDYKRNGTTTLFAALNMLDGKVIGQCQNRHRHQEWLKFMRRLDREFPAELILHVIMDNYGTHKTPVVKKWLEKHPRFVCHFIPTSSSWLNMVERWFRELTNKAIRLGAFVSVPDLEKSIDEYLAAWNENPRPFIWTATVGEIVKKLARAREKLEAINPGCTRPRQRKTKQSTIV